jgi:signal transduction histidine kinase
MVAAAEQVRRVRELVPIGGERRATIESICRLVLTFRQLVLLVALAYIVYEGEEVLALGAAFVVAALASYLPLRYWDRLGPAVVSHPGMLALDLAITLGVLALAGPVSPFFFYTLATATLGGILYGWVGAAVYAFILAAGYLLIGELVSDPGLEGFQETVGLPLLYPLAGAAGAELRGLARWQAETEAEVGEADRAAAASEERARLAREMHDSLAKTLHGLAFSAAALGRKVERDPKGARADLRSLASLAARAAADTRELISELRGHQLEAPLGAAIREYADSWSEETGVEVLVRADGADLSSARGRHELFFILKEALTNVERHAGASSVSVALQSARDELSLSVADDGVGMAEPRELEGLRDGRHYGLVGMSERAARLGGYIEIDSAPGVGTKVSVTVPTRPRGEGGEDADPYAAAVRSSEE